MVDDILDKKSDGQLKTSFIGALGEKNGTKVLNEVLVANPSFKSETTRLEVMVSGSQAVNSKLIK